MPQMTPPKSPELTRLAWALTALVILAAVWFFFVWWVPSFTGAVDLLVRDTAGGHGVYSYSLADKSLTPEQGIDARFVVSSSAKLYQRTDGSVIGLTPAGVVMADVKNRTSVLIASPVPPTLHTPLAVWAEGARIAWMSPADNSIQVFERTTRGTYLPLVLNKDIVPNSLGFTEDGSTLVVTRFIKDGTEVYAMNLSGGSLAKVGVIPGVATIISKP